MDMSCFWLGWSSCLVPAGEVLDWPWYRLGWLIPQGKLLDKSATSYFGYCAHRYWKNLLLAVAGHPAPPAGLKS
jgi:hypothetical protein